MKTQELTPLKGHALDDMFGWIDWRSPIDNMAEIFQTQMGDGGNFTDGFRGRGAKRFHFKSFYFRRDLSDPAEGYGMRPLHCHLLYGRNLTRHTRGLASHGILVLAKEQSDELKEHHAAWVEQYVSPLPFGVDQFSGVAIPYYGHEDNAHCIEKDWQAIDQARAEWNAKIKADTEKYMDRYVAMEKAANRKSLIERFGFPAAIGTLVLIAVLIAIAPD